MAVFASERAMGPANGPRGYYPRMAHPDVAVVGAGVFGVWTARRLRASGRTVALVDAHGTGHPRAASGGESRIIRVGYGDRALYSAWARDALGQWQRLFEETGEALFVRTGVLWFARPDDPAAEVTARTVESLRVALERLDQPALRERFPQFDVEPYAGALFEPESGVLLARRAVALAARDARRQGVQFRHGAAAAPVEPAGGPARLSSLPLADGSRLPAGTFVFACGAWMPRLFPRLLAPLIRPTRQEVGFLGPPAGDGRFAPPAMPAWIDRGAEAYGLPSLDGRGVKVALHEHGPVFDPETGDRTPTAGAMAAVRAAAAERLPALRNAPLVEARVCQYANTWNGDLLIDRHPEFENVWLAGGGSGHGFKLGPAVGAYLTARMDGSGREEALVGLASKRPEPDRHVF